MPSIAYIAPPPPRAIEWAIKFILQHHICSNLENYFLHYQQYRRLSEIVLILFQYHIIRIRILDRLKKQPRYDSSHHEINKLIRLGASVEIEIWFT